MVTIIQLESPSAKSPGGGLPFPAAPWRKFPQLFFPAESCFCFASNKSMNKIYVCDDDDEDDEDDNVVVDVHWRTRQGHDQYP